MTGYGLTSLLYKVLLSDDLLRSLVELETAGISASPSCRTFWWLLHALTSVSVRICPAYTVTHRRAFFSPLNLQLADSFVKGVLAIFVPVPVLNQLFQVLRHKGDDVILPNRILPFLFSSAVLLHTFTCLCLSAVR